MQITRRNKEAAKKKEYTSTLNLNNVKHTGVVWKQQTTFIEPSFD